MIVMMAYDEDLANRIRELIASEDGYTEQKMFGGISFMIDGHMAVGVSGEGGLMIHCSKEESEALLARPGARAFEMRGRELKGWVRGDAERRLRPGVAAKEEVMSLDDADTYDRFMGRFSRPLAVPFADFAGLPRDGRVLDVGCGSGALTAELARRARPGRVTAVDPSEEFVAALRGRHPGVQVIRAPAEDLPFEGGCFDATLAQLVVNVMDDPVSGLREMARVTRDGGVVAACVWDFTDGGPIGPFWAAAQALDAQVETGSVCPGSRAGHLADLFRAAGIGDIVDGAVAVDVDHATFEDWWEPFTLGVAPSGAHVAGLEPDRRTALRELCRERLPEPPFVVSAKAWVARGAA